MENITGVVRMDVMLELGGGRKVVRAAEAREAWWNDWGSLKAILGVRRSRHRFNFQAKPTWRA